MDDLPERDLVLDHDPVTRAVLEVLEGAAPLLAELHHRADVGRRHDDGQLHERLGDGFDHGGVRQERRVVDFHYLTALQLDPVLDGRRRGDELELELALEALLDDLEVEKAEEPAPKSEPQGRRVFWLEGKRAIVELQLLQRFLQVAELIRIGRKESCKHHRLDLPVTRQGRGGAVLGAGDGVTDPRVDYILDRRGHIADLARRQLLGAPRPGREPTDLVDVVDLAGVHHPDLGARDDLAVHDPDVRDDAAVRVVVRVEDQCAQRL